MSVSVTNRKFKRANAALIAALALALSGCGEDTPWPSNDQITPPASTPPPAVTPPITTPPGSDIGMEGAALTIFNDTVSPKWTLFNSSDISLATTATDSNPLYGAVAQFTVADNGETVAGFTSKTTSDGHNAVGGEPFSAIDMVDQGTFEFDIKVVTDTPAPTTWFVKFESSNGDFGEVAIPVAPTSNWSHVSIPLADIAKAQPPQWAIELGLGAVDMTDVAVMLIYPAWQAGADAVYQIDNVGIFANDGEVIDTVAPVITLLGEAVVNIDAGAAYVDAGVTIYDKVDTNLVAVVGGDVVDVNTDGTYVITYNVTDSAGNVAKEVTRTVIVSSEDVIAPVITLTGGASVTLHQFDTYVEQGATALDNIDGDITLDIVTDSSAVDTTVIGVYDVTYNVADMAGNTATQVVRKVNVIDPDAAPIIKNGDFESPLTGEWELQEGAGTITIVNGELVVEGISPGAPYQPRLVQGDVIVTEGVTYAIRFDAMVSEARNIQVQFGELLSGDPWFNPFMNDQTVSLTTNMESYELLVTPNANAVNSGDLIFALGAGVSTTVTLDNISVTEITETEIAPVITLLGDSAVTINVGDSYNDAGVTALDNLDGDLTASVVVDNPVDVNTAGVYTITYNVTDNDGNQAKPVIRTVTVKEVSSGGDNLVSNGDFSGANIAPWFQVGAGTVELVDGAVVTTATAGSETRIKQQNIGQGTLVAGQSITISFDMKGSAVNGAVVNGIVHTESSAGVSGTEILDIPAPTSEWVTHSFDVIVGSDPSWGVALTIGGVCGAVAGCEAVAMFDNISVVAGDGGSGPSIPPVEEPIDPPTSDNFVTNGDFTNDLIAPWFGPVTAAGGVANITIEGGEGRMKQEKIGQGEIVAGQQMTLSFDVKGTAGAGAVFNGIVHTMDTTGVSATFVTPNIDPTTGWVRHSFDFTVGNAVGWGLDLTMGPVCGAVAGCGMNVDIDNIWISAK